MAERTLIYRMILLTYNFIRFPTFCFMILARVTTSQLRLSSTFGIRWLCD